MSDSGGAGGDDEVGLPKATVYKLIQGEQRQRSGSLQEDRQRGLQLLAGTC